MITPPHTKPDGVSAVQPMMAPLDELMGLAQATEGRVGTTGIGDGGNEVGMGNVLPLVQQHIKNGPTIGCVTGADFLITSSVSNWGGYALAAALVRGPSDPPLPARPGR